MGEEPVPADKALGKKFKKKNASWSIEESEALYRVEAWGAPYFAINAAGNITVSPNGDRGGSLDLLELVEALRQRKLGLPLLIRFSDILADRLERLNSCFAKAIARYNYPNTYQAVYPVKCNQQRHLVEALVRFGQTSQCGLEAGSKVPSSNSLADRMPGPTSAEACKRAWRNHGHSCFLCEIVIRSQFHTTYEPEA